MTEPFCMSIEETEGEGKLYGFHLGTDERLARDLVEGHFHARTTVGMVTVTIALMRKGKIVDVFYGDSWDNE